MEATKIEIEVDKKLDYWPALAWLNDEQFVEKAFCANGVLTIHVDSRLTQEAIFEIGFNAGLKFGKIK